MLPIDLTQDILRVLSKNHSTFIAKELGLDFLSIQDKLLLKNFGVDFTNLYSQDTDTIRNAYEFGQVSAYAKESQLKELNYSQLKDYVKSKNSIKLTKRDFSVIRGVKQQVETSIRSLQNRMANDINQIILNKYNELYQNEAVESTKDIQLDKDTIKQILGDIQKKLKKWESEFERIIVYNSTSSFERGKSEVTQKLEGADTLVYKVVHPEACKWCQKLFISRSFRPIVFTLKQLIANGSNIGRKNVDWKATIDPIHNYCRCKMIAIPAGMIYNPVTRNFDLKDTKYKAPKKKLRDKIKFELAGVQYTV